MVLRLITTAIILLVFSSGSVLAAYKEGEILIKLRPGAKIESVKTVLKGASVERSIDKIRVKKIRLPKGMTVEEAVEHFSKLPGVEYAGPNHIIRLSLIPNDIYFYDSWADEYRQWGLYDAYNPTAGIDAADAWDIQTGSSSITIAVVDTGISSAHGDLNDKLVPGYNTLTGAPDPYDTEDDNGHGTFVAGIAAAESNNSLGVTGTCWGAKIMPVKSFASSGNATEDDIAAGIIWAADNGADVINMSFGGYGTFAVERDAIEYAHMQGCVLVAATGNEDSTTDHFPAAFDQTIAVGASDKNMQRCTTPVWPTGGSNYGDYIDCVAPGVDIFSTAWFSGGPSYGTGYGTSSATPFVSGIAALLMSEHPSWSNIQVALQIKRTCKDTMATGWDTETGWGVASAYNALSTAPLSPVGPGNTTALSDGDWVYMENVVLTTDSNDFNDYFYAEDFSRAAGIRLDYPNGVPEDYEVGDIVDIAGRMTTVDGVRAVTDTSIIPAGTTTPLSPLYLSNMSVGGADKGNTPGVTGGVGLNNMNMFVAVAGEVTYRTFTYLYLDDGSGLSDTSGYTGLRVIYPFSMQRPSVGDYIRVEGYVTTYKPAGSTDYYPAIEITGQQNITTVGP